MTLTPQERASMVRDLENLERLYVARAQDTKTGIPEKVGFYISVAANYSALASALKEGLTFNEVA